MWVLELMSSGWPRPVLILVIQSTLILQDFRESLTCRYSKNRTSQTCAYEPKWKSEHGQ